MPAYVVLYHSGIDHPHFDLLLDPDGVSPLLSWRVSDWPPTSESIFESIGDHRRAYLTYEGPISNGRGWVEQRESGTYEWVAEGKIVRLNGKLTLDLGA